MEKINCLRCNFRHTDNGNCTAVGGFCTAVPAAHCPLLRDFLDTGLTPDEIRNMSGEWCAAMSVLNGMGSYDRLRELAKADKDGRVVMLPCKVGDTVYTNNRVLGADNAMHDEICTRRIKGYSGNALNEVWLISNGDYCDLSIFPSEFGKTVFLSREEAERALQEMEGKKDG